MESALHLRHEFLGRGGHALSSRRRLGGGRVRRFVAGTMALAAAGAYVWLVLGGVPPERSGSPARPPGGAPPPPEVADLAPDPEAASLLPRWDDAWAAGLEPATDSAADVVAAGAAERAWAFMVRNYSPRTGLVRAHDDYRFVTMWDVASALAGYYAAGRLGLTDPQDYRERAGRALRTLATAPLFEDRLFNKVYDAETGAALDAETLPSADGYGWSAVDLGRLLIWLRILHDEDPDLAPLADSVVARLDLEAALGDGVLLGRERGPVLGSRSYQEGRIGYEQYAARGFALWGGAARTAEDPFANAVIDTVHGRPVPRDVRGADCLTSEPIVLAGMEFGWDATWGELARATLEAQHARYLATDTVTIVSEDASSTPPHYFYYYCVSSGGEPFVVTAKGDGGGIDGPRWVSAKASLAWYALAPSAYTALAVRTVGDGAGDEGWPAGVLEGAPIPSGGENVNTAGVTLEAALYASVGAPFLNPQRAEGSSAPR